MRKRYSEQPTEKWIPTSADTDEMRKGMKAFETKVINGRKWYPFEQYCYSKEYIKPGKYGEMIVCSIPGWQKANEIKDLLEWQNQKDLESFHQAHPEEREKHEVKVRAIMSEIKKLV